MGSNEYFDTEKKFKNLKEKEDYFWSLEPDYIGWDELKEINRELHRQLLEIARELVAANRLTVSYVTKFMKERL